MRGARLSRLTSGLWCMLYEFVRSTPVSVHTSYKKLTWIFQRKKQIKAGPKSQEFAYLHRATQIYI